MIVVIGQIDFRTDDSHAEVIVCPTEASFVRDDILWQQPSELTLYGDGR